MIRSLTLLLLVASLITACGRSQEEIAASVAMTVEALATDTPQPTNTRPPTRTPRPTATPRPQPTSTPRPTPWPVADQGTLDRLEISTDPIDGSVLITYRTVSERPRGINGTRPVIYHTDDQTSLLLTFSYSGDDWLFIDEVAFNVDGELYRIEPDDVDREVLSSGRVNEDGFIALDERFEFAEALIHADEVLMRYSGSDGRQDRTMTEPEIEDLRVMYQVYRNLLDGEVRLTD